MKLTVIQSNPNQKGGFVTKLSAEQTVKTVLGTKTAKVTYYSSSQDQLTAGDVLDVNLADFNVSEHEMANPQTGETFMGKWLHAKVTETGTYLHKSETATIAETAVA